MSSLGFFSVEKLALLVLVAASAAAWRPGIAVGALERVRAVVAQSPRAAFWALVAALYGVAWLTTSPIGFGTGLEGAGYGHDGVHYGWMVEHFAWFQNPVEPPFNYRSLIPALIHYLGIGTFFGFKYLNAVSFVLCCCLVRSIALNSGASQVRSLAAVLLFGTLKFGLKFWIYYPVLTDGLGTLFFLAAVHFTLTRNLVAYLATLSAALFCRENLLVLVGFNLIHLWRTRAEGTGPSKALVVGAQLVPLAVFALSRVFPVFPPARPYDAISTILANAEWLFTAPDRHARIVYGFVNSLGAFLVIPMLRWRECRAILRAEPEWLFLALVNLALSVFSGIDVDRYALWQLPVALILFARLPLRADDRGVFTWAWFHVCALHALLMEFPLGWRPDEGFYLSRYLAHAQGVWFGFLAVSCLAFVAVVYLMRRRLGWNGLMSRS